MDIQERVAGVVEALKESYPDPRCALEYEKDYELMIAVRLSAQCTDERVNLVTPALFARYPTLESLAHRLADKVKRTGEEIRLEPMSAGDRRMIHLALQDDGAVSTESDGEAPYRCVVIRAKQ